MFHPHRLRLILLTFALAACLTALAVGCTGNTTDDPRSTTPGDSTDTPTSPEPPPGTDAPTEPEPEVPTEAPTEEPTEAPTEAPTEPDPPETNKYVIQSFEEGEPSDQLSSLDWTNLPYGIVNPVLSGADAGTDLGRGLTVTLPAGAACQSFTIQSAAVKEGFTNAASYQYLRLWICNQSGGVVSVGIYVDGNGGQLAFDGDSIIACRCDGTEMDLPRNDASGMGKGHNSAVAVPDGFEGWISFPLTGTMQNWDYTILKDISKTSKITIDLRPAGNDADGYYILDELALTNAVHGERRRASGKGYMTTTEEKRAAIADAFAALREAAPAVKEIPEYTPTMAGYTHIRAITYDGLDKNGQKTKVFAYIGFPEGASAEHPVPAIVLIHGGGGHAFLEWVKMWNDRGYAAIAMDNTGYFPTVVNAGESEVTQGFAYGLSGIFREDGYVNAPNNDGMGSSDGKVENMWMYHAVGSVIVANNILRADARVDSSKIGVTGISWGGVITSIAIGWDNRFAFAIPIYGSGHLTEARAWIKDNFAGEATQALWSAADNFDKVTMPVLWLGWNDDSCFSVNSHSASYADTIGLNSQTRLSFIHQMMHSHGCGWGPAESMIFADSVVKGTGAMAGFAEQPSGRDIDVKLDIPGDTVVRKVRLFWIPAPQTYSRHQKYGYTDTFMDQVWQISSLTYDKASGKVTGTVPAEAAAYYIEVTSAVDKVTVVTCSQFIELE